jgi:hypothetical protein
MSIGMNLQSGTVLSGIDHIKQSIADILTTPIGSRVMLPEYGSRLFDLTDQPLSVGFILQLKVAVIEAIDRWEPRVKVLKVDIDSASPINFALSLFVIGSDTTTIQVAL